jgi:hypothetical protein
VAHIGIDRAIGYGLKCPTAFGDTRLGRKGGGNQRRWTESEEERWMRRR